MKLKSWFLYVGLRWWCFLKIRIKAPPEKGKANCELIKFLAKELKMPKSAVRIIKGEKSREKVVIVELI